MFHLLYGKYGSSNVAVHTRNVVLPSESIVTTRNLVDSSLQDDPTLTRFVPLIEISLPVRSNF